ncbi:COX15/CtaA family protein [Leucobacter chironomi]|uniref:COX15/CtaA family protein n=1 Tax=Leucobacter chironomi TaxID=491918 RepID=UPI000402195D|nr:COX15/CtaA family protein [Leucobacter chironomi]
MSTPSSSIATSASGSRGKDFGVVGGAARPSGLLRFAAWVSFVLNVVIIGTGGAVRLTGSGLGCSEWPLCTPESLTPTPELGIHGLIEFGNRTISGPILIFAVLVVVLSWRLHLKLQRRLRRDLAVLSTLVLGLVLLQAVVGGVIVWLHLNANLVGFHYVVSLLLVCLTAAYLVRMYESPLPRELAVPRSFAILTHVTTFVMAISIFVGVLTTGAGPHSGDDRVVRDGFDASLLAHVHAWPGYAALALTVVLVVWATVQRLRPRAWGFVLLGVLLVQILVGVYQARNGLPPFAVGVHMVLASLTAASMTVVVLRLKRPRGRVEEIPAEAV